MSSGPVERNHAARSGKKMDRKPSPKPRYDLIKSFVDDEVFLIPRWLPQKYLANCILVSDRAELLRRLPRQAVVAEIGTQRGDFAKQILEICEPREFHVFDLSFRDFDRAFFDAAISQRQVILHEGDSSTEMTKLPDGAFDWIYIDGDHTFEGVLRDIREAKRLIKPNGFLVFNDYTNYSPLEQMQYGVMRAVNDLCIDGDFEIVIFALSALGYHDVALRRRSLLPDSREEVSDKSCNSSRVPNEIYEVKEMLGDEERRGSTIKMELADFAKRCWETGRKIELTGGMVKAQILTALFLPSRLPTIIFWQAWRKRRGRFALSRSERGGAAQRWPCWQGGVSLARLSSFRLILNTVISRI
jgi:SAM-dependent methyltransferase